MPAITKTFRSRAFLRDVAGLLLLVAGISALWGIQLLVNASSEDETVGAIGHLVGAFVYVVVAILMWRGSYVAFWIAAALFGLDTLALLATGDVGLIGKGIVLFFVYRAFKKHRVAD